MLEAAGISTGLITTAAAKVGLAADGQPGARHHARGAAAAADAAGHGRVPATRPPIVETTSHGLALDRVAEIAYDVAIFTNLTHEHLELHGTFEAYRDAKLSLFRRLGDDARPSGWHRAWPRVGDRERRRPCRAALRRSGPAAPAPVS